MSNRRRLAAKAAAIGSLPPHRNPYKNPSAMALVHPTQAADLAAIKADPALHALATGGGQGSGSAADPTGSRDTTSHTGWGAGASGQDRQPDVRHVLLGFQSTALTAGQTNVLAKATPQVDYKANRLVSMPGVTGTLAQPQSGVKPQYANLTSEDMDMYQPASYGGEVDWDPVKAAVSFQLYVNNGNATAAQTWYGCLVGVAIGIPYRQFTSKLQSASLGTSGSVSANGTGSLTLTPLIGYTTRKILFTPGTSFSDAFIITSITAGIQNQLMSGDPIPASVFSDLFPLFVDFDRVSPSVPLTINYTNVSTGSATLKGSTRGDCDPQDLVKFGNMVGAGGA